MLSAHSALLPGALGLVRLARPLSLLGIGLCVVTSIRLGGGPRALDGRDAVVVAGWVLLAAGGYVLDDVRDQALDARFHPARPIPSGLVPPGVALRVAIGLLATGATVLACGYAGLWAVGIATAMLLYGYGEGLKRTSALGANIAVSALLAAAAASGGFRAGEWRAVAVLALMTFWVNLGREIVMDIADLEPDRQQGYRTLPLTHGARAARWVAAVCLALGGGCGYLLSATGAAPPSSFVLALTMINLWVVLWVLAPLMEGRSDLRLVGLIKTAMFAYLALVLLATA